MGRLTREEARFQATLISGVPFLLIYALSLWAVWEWATGWGLWLPTLGVPILFVVIALTLQPGSERHEPFFGPEADSVVLVVAATVILFGTFMSGCGALLSTFTELPYQESHWER